MSKNSYGKGNPMPQGVRTFIIVLVAIGLLVGTLFLTGVFKLAAGVDKDEETPVVYTTFNFKFYERNGTVLDGNDDRPQGYGFLYEYEYEPLEFDQSDYDELPFSAFSLAKSEIEHNDIYTPSPNTLYILKANGTLFGELYYIPILGENSIYLTRTPDDCQLLTFSDEMSTTLNQTNDLHWYGKIAMLDVNDTIDDNMGYHPYIDYSNVVNMRDDDESLVYNVLTFDFNCSAINKLAVDLDGLVYDDVIVDDDEIQFFINQDFVGLTEFEFTLDSDKIGSSWEIESISFQRGIYGDALTNIDTWAE